MNQNHYQRYILDEKLRLFQNLHQLMWCILIKRVIFFQKENLCSRF